MKRQFLLLAGLCSITVLQAQQDDTRSLREEGRAYSMAWLDLESSTTPYINSKTLDSNSTQLYLAPSLNYYHRSGLGVKIKSYAFLSGSDPGFYSSALSAYFARYSGKLRPYLSYTRYILHGNPSSPYTPIANEIFGQLRWHGKLLDFTGGVDYGFGNDSSNNDESVSDVNVFAAISRNIELNKGLQSLVLIPTVQLNAGTDRYFKYSRLSSYMSKGRSLNNLLQGNGQRRGGAGNGSGSSEWMMSETNAFGLSNLELNAALYWFVGKFSITPSGSLYIPLRSDYEFSGYWQVNLSYYFR